MKRFTKEQLIFFIVSIIAVLLLTYKTVGFDLIIGLSPQSIKYQSSVDSIITLEKNLSDIQNGTYVTKRDLFNFPNTKKTVIIQPVVATTGEVKVVKKTNAWKSEITPWGTDKLELQISGGSKSTISVSGSSKKYSVGDQLQCANSTEFEIEAETGELTGKQKEGGIITGTIYSMDKRNVYISIPTSSKMIKLNLRDGAKLIDSDMVPPPTKNSDDEEVGGSGSGTTQKPKKQR